METKRTIRVFSPDQSMFADVTNVPQEITAKEFVENVSKLTELRKLNKKFKIKAENGYLNDDELIPEDAAEIYLINEEDTLPLVIKHYKLVIAIIFYVAHLIPLILLIFHKSLYGLSFYIIGYFVFSYIKSLDPEKDETANNIIDGIRLFFVSLIPGFQLEDAAVNAAH